MVYIISLVAIPLTLLYICIQSFEMLPSDIFLDFDENKKLFTRPYIHQDSDLCISVLFFLLSFFVAMTTQFETFDHHSFFQILRYIVISILLGHIFISDFLFQIIPDEHLLLILIANFGNFGANSLISGLFGFLPLFLLTLVAYILLGYPAIGFGDIKLLSVLGLLTAPTAILAVQILACTLSGIFCIGIVIANFLYKMKKDKASTNLHSFVPLAPFIIFAFGFIHAFASQLHSIL